jgi:hypothetical protein
MIKASILAHTCLMTGACRKHIRKRVEEENKIHTYYNGTKASETHMQGKRAKNKPVVATVRRP